MRVPLLVLRSKYFPLPEIEALGTDVLRLRVGLADMDFNLHMNNARYLTVMDYARVHLLARGGVLGPMLQEHWAPVVGAVWMTYRRSLPVWARYTLESRLVGWDARWFYMEQVFRSEAGLVAVGWVKGALVAGKAGIVDPRMVMERVKPGVASPELPEGWGVWNEVTREKLGQANVKLQG